MTAIYKYRLEITETQVVSMPKGAQILTAQMQDGYLCLWALVNTDKKSAMRSIVICGTGNPIPSGEDFTQTHRYIATVQEQEFVWHVFEFNA